MKQKFGLLVFAIICGLAAMLLMQVYIKSKTDALKKRFQEAEVIKVSQDVAVGTVLTEQNKTSLLGFGTELKNHMTSDMITPEQVNLLIGRKFEHSVAAKSILRWSDF